MNDVKSTELENACQYKNNQKSRGRLKYLSCISYKKAHTNDLLYTFKHATSIHNFFLTTVSSCNNYKFMVECRHEQGRSCC